MTAAPETAWRQPPDDIEPAERVAIDIEEELPPPGTSARQKLDAKHAGMVQGLLAGFVAHQGRAA